jgi:multimeric flavodoxin WrbA
MRVMAFNASPRKKWNTATMLEHALRGAAEAGAETELVHLYSLDFKGCSSCFSCKRHGRKQTGVCALQDDLSPVLERAAGADALILGTPVYYGAETACARAFIERLQFPFLNYADYDRPHFPRRIPTGLVYTMNIPAEMLEAWGYNAAFERTRANLARHFGSCELVLACNTTQYNDYDKYETGFDKHEKARYRAAHFEEDCGRAFVMGARLATGMVVEG